MTPRRPSSLSRRRPVATGGSTRGKAMTVSRIDFPGQWPRASSQASATPNGRMTSVLQAETQAVNQTICHSSVVTDHDLQGRLTPASMVESVSPSFYGLGAAPVRRGHPSIHRMGMVDHAAMLPVKRGSPKDQIDVQNYRNAVLSLARAVHRYAPACPEPCRTCPVVASS